MYKDIMRDVFLEYERKRDKQEKERKSRIQYVYNKIPAISRIDEEILRTSIAMAKYVIGNPSEYKDSVEKTKQAIEALKMEKAFLLTESNIPSDYMDLKYECESCKDTGYMENGLKCNCLKQELVNRAYKMSNLGNVLRKENFHSFNIEIFSK